MIYYGLAFPITHQAKNEAKECITNFFFTPSALRRAVQDAKRVKSFLENN